MPDLELHDVRRRYGGDAPVDALTGVDLTIRQGEFVAIEGPSGGGKSTLLNIIGLLDVPTGGRYAIGGTDIADTSSRAIAELRSERFAFIFQSFHLLDRRPVIESVEMGLLYRAVPVEQRRRRAIDALYTVGLAHLAWQTAGKLSGGQRQRVAIARALAAGAPIIVADEPTGNLDTANSDAVVESLRALHRSGSTIVLVTHSHDVAAAATRRLQIRDGRLAEPAAQGCTDGSVATAPAPPGRPSRLRFRDLIVDAMESLRSRTGRTTGLIAAVTVGVALAVATLGISSSATAQVSATFDAHTNRDVTVSWDGSQLASQSAVERTSLVTRLDALDGTDASGIVSSYGGHGVQASPTRDRLQVSTFGVTSAVPDAGRMQVHWASGHPHRLGKGEMLVGVNLAQQLQLGPLDAGPAVALDGRDETVVGIVKASPRLTDLLGGVAVGSSDTAGLGERSNVQALLLTRAGAAQVIAREAPLVIDPYQPKQLTVDAPTDPTTLRAQVESAVQSTLIALTGVALLASIAGLANAMVLSVLERKQEFGLRRAVGARPIHLLGLVLSESAMIGAIGGVAGLVLGVGGILAVTLAKHWSPTFDIALAPTAIAGGVVVGAIGGILASVRASRIQPNEALRL
jgi:macrolide transport system ATP-binding/permease protein